MEWSNWAVSLLRSEKVKLLGRCVAAAPVLTMMQEIVLYVSFYIHSSIFTDVSKSTWRIGSSPNVDSTLHPLLQLFKHLTIKPYQKVAFTPEELSSRKRSLNLEDDLDERAALLAIAKRRKGFQQYQEQNKEEEDTPESYMNQVVGTEIHITLRKWKLQVHSRVT